MPILPIVTQHGSLDQTQHHPSLHYLRYRFQKQQGLLLSLQRELWDPLSALESPKHQISEVTLRQLPLFTFGVVDNDLGREETIFPGRRSTSKRMNRLELGHLCVSEGIPILATFFQFHLLFHSSFILSSLFWKTEQVRLNKSSSIIKANTRKGESHDVQPTHLQVPRLRLRTSHLLEPVS